MKYSNFVYFSLFGSHLGLPGQVKIETLKNLSIISDYVHIVEDQENNNIMNIYRNVDVDYKDMRNVVCQRQQKNLILFIKTLLVVYSLIMLQHNRM
jgi:hypothetical protein